MIWTKLVNFGRLFGVCFFVLLFFVLLLAVAIVFVSLGLISYAWDRMKKWFISFFTTWVLFFPNIAEAHPDGATPFWYPSSYIYGFVEGCWQTVEISRAPFTEEMWPDDVRSACGCVVDSLRHSLTFTEVTRTDNASLAGMQLIVNATLPICINQELTKKERDKNGGA
tara:strand:+ start:970 stop:1473 length:504 start_codon:yes stop_codon:yes gene_type:complete